MRKIYNNLSNEQIQRQLEQLSGGKLIYPANRKRVLELQYMLSYESKLIVIDTETNGLPLNYDAPITNTKNWPRLVQLSYLLPYKTVASIEEFARGIEEVEKVSCSSFIVKPKDFVISSESTAIHGISQSEAMSKGDELYFVLVALGQAITNIENNNSKIIIGHNVEYDIKVLSAEYYRMGLDNPFENATIIDTMKASVNYCKIPGQYGHYKWPKLQELYNFLFGKDFDGAHNAEADVRATYECYCELQKRGIIR